MFSNVPRNVGGVLRGDQLPEPDRTSRGRSSSGTGYTRIESPPPRRSSPPRDHLPPPDTARPRTPTRRQSGSGVPRNEDRS
jgi:hypothetical protein